MSIFKDLDDVKKSKYKVSFRNDYSVDLCIPDVKINYKNRTYIFGDITLYISFSGGITVYVSKCDRGHPHIRGTEICLGQATDFLINIILEYQRTSELYLLPIAIVLESVLSTYGDKPFYKIENFTNNGNICYVCSKLTACINQIWGEPSKWLCSDCSELCKIKKGENRIYYSPELIEQCKSCKCNKRVLINDKLVCNRCRK